jgi:hypothetical protein
MSKGKCALCVSFPLILWAVVVPNLTGTWNLNGEKSHWGKKEKPAAVIVQIEHNEPAWKYSGTVTMPDSEQKKFSYDGAIDGKEHDAISTYGPGKMSIKRLNRFTTVSSFHTNDGRFVETATTTSTDGRVMTRRMHLKSPDGEVSWVEVYEKQ